jgi:hypothetical protein
VQLHPVVQHGYRLGVPRGGAYREVLNTDAALYGGSNVGNQGRVEVEAVPSHGRPQSVALTLPPLAVVSTWCPRNDAAACAAPGMTPGRPCRWAPPGRATASISRCSRPRRGGDLCLFDATGRRELARIPLPGRTGDTWHGFLPGVGPGLVYGYRVHGRYAPRQGTASTSTSCCSTPTPARWSGRAALRQRDLRLPPRRAEEWRQDISDSASSVPKARVVDPHAFDWRGDRPPGTPMDRHVIYELHTKGFTRLHPDVPPHLRGTYLGLAQPAVLEYLVGLGVTAVELMPVQQFITEPHLQERGLGTTGATTRWRFSRRTPATRSPTRCGSSARWCARCTAPGSRSSSTWCSTTRRRAAAAAPRCRCAASTT